MDLYYYVDPDNEQRGPVPADRLNEYGITRDTLVWKEGMGKWKPAGEIPELQFLFLAQDTAIPPPPHTGGVPPQNGIPLITKPKSYLVWSILSTVCCCLPLGIAAIVYSARVDSLWGQGKYLEAVRASNKAKLFCLVSLGLGIVTGILSIFSGAFKALLNV